MKEFSIGTLLRSPFGRSLALILLGFTLAPVLALIALNAIVTPARLRERATTQMVTVANLVQQATTRWLTAATDQLTLALDNTVITQNATFILRTPVEAPRPAQVLSQDLTALLRQPYFTRLHLVHQNGNVALSTDPSLKGKPLGIDLARLEAVGQHFWGFGQFPLTGKIAALTWRPVIDARQQTLGFLVGELNMQSLVEILNENRVGLGQTGEAYIVGEDMAPLTALRYAPETNSTVPVVFDETLKAVVRDRQDAYQGTYENYARQSVIGAVQHLTALQAWLVVEQQQSEALETLNTILQVTVLFTLLLAALALVAALFATQRIATPLQSLAQAAQTMARGQLNTRVNIQRKDEFGSLGTSFNAMASGLEKAFGELETSNKKLSIRAEQFRTMTSVGQLATSFLELNQLLTTIAGEIQRSMDYRVVRLYLAAPKGETLILRAMASAATKTASEESTPYPIDHSTPAGKAAAERKLEKLGTQLCIPLLVGSGERLIGILEIQTDKPGAFSTDEVEVLQILAHQIAIAIRNADLFTESEQARHTADEANRQKSEFLSNMSHELRTPLNVIIGYSHSILNRPSMYKHVPLPEIYKDPIESIMAGGQHLLGLINDILDLSKIEAGQIDLNQDVVDPLPILQGVRQTALGLVRQNVQVRANYPDKLPRIYGDEVRIRQILLNLVSNAAKFTAQGFITIDAKAQDTMLLFSVTDTGPGIPDEAKPLLFNRFQQASRDILKKHGGTGLGLSISRHLTLLHNGKIWFESKLGEGSVFYFTIPLHVAPTSEEASIDTKPTRPTKLASALSPVPVEISSRVSLFAPEERLETTPIHQVMLFDTLSETRSKLQTALSEAGYDVILANDADYAVTLATTMLPEAIVLHLHNENPPPTVDVEQLLRQEKDLAQTPIVVVRDAKAEASTAPTMETQSDTQTAPGQQPAWLKKVLEQVDTALRSKAAP